MSKTFKQFLINKLNNNDNKNKNNYDSYNKQ